MAAPQSPQELANTPINQLGGANPAYYVDPAKFLPPPPRPYAIVGLWARRGFVLGLLVGLAICVWLLWSQDSWRPRAAAPAIAPVSVEDPAELSLLALGTSENGAGEIVENLMAFTQNMDMSGAGRFAQSVNKPGAPHLAVRVVRVDPAEGNLNSVADVASLREKVLDELGLVPVAPLARKELKKGVVWVGKVHDGPNTYEAYVYQPFRNVVVVVTSSKKSNADNLMGGVLTRYKPPNPEGKPLLGN